MLYRQSKRILMLYFCHTRIFILAKFTTHKILFNYVCNILYIWIHTHAPTNTSVWFSPFFLFRWKHFRIFFVEVTLFSKVIEHSNYKRVLKFYFIRINDRVLYILYAKIFMRVSCACCMYICVVHYIYWKYFACYMYYQSYVSKARFMLYVS